jgi:colanic acid/amylovoran biosynthesis glycosyltransferase
MVGREVDKKGFDDGLRACARARDAGTDLTVTILGTGGVLRPDLERLADELHLEVTWPDPRSDVAAAMALSDVLLVPSRTAADGDQEGTPTVICEGSAAGLPIVSTRHAGIPEQVDHGHHRPARPRARRRRPGRRPHRARRDPRAAAPSASPAAPRCRPSTA